MATGKDQVYFVGVDVGTASARAAVVSTSGKVLSTASHPIQVLSFEGGRYEQSSDDIWDACCCAVTEAVRASNVAVDAIKGIGFDATCSLVIVSDLPLPISKDLHGDVIMWADHRANDVAKEMNATNHPVLKRFGGGISPEMSAAKVAWLARQFASTPVLKHITHLMELPDYLTYRATGNRTTRSLCSLSCKWTYVQGEGWPVDFWKQFDVDFSKPGDVMASKMTNESVLPLPAGHPIAHCISSLTAKQLGLNEETVVAAPLIDAYAVGSATLATPINSDDHPALELLGHRLAVIAGTSTCHIALSRQINFVPGVWGPYTDVILSGFHCAEGGQSATGQLLDHLIKSHPAANDVVREAAATGSNVHIYLNDAIKRMTPERQLPFAALLTETIHVTPDFHGNRSPFADPNMRGTVTGLDLGANVQSLAKLYYAGVLALCYGTKQIIQTMNQNGYEIDSVFLGGGLSKNDLFVESLADVLGMPVVLGGEEEVVLLGSAILAATAYRMASMPSKDAGDALWQSMCEMSAAGRVAQPNQNPQLESFHNRKYAVFLRMYEQQRELRDIMTAETT
ncbi:FGGY carbohydrate kinase domain-containing protein [Gaertneriomyces semiglobifer]|nr:FGGY carbohydrate kinase domain-containing protein [Gaertneriomyces semiglobifer]